MTNLKQLDKNLDTFDKIISNLTDFSEVAISLKKAQESIVTWTQEIKTIKDEVVKYVWLIDKKYEKFIKETVSAMEENKNDINKKLSNNKSEISAAVRDQGIEIERWLKNAFISKKITQWNANSIKTKKFWISIYYSRSTICLKTY